MNEPTSITSSELKSWSASIEYNVLFVSLNTTYIESICHAFEIFETIW